MEKFATKINNFFYGTEKRAGIYTTAFLVSLLLMAVACLFTTSRWEPHYHGNDFSELSENPFDLSQENPLRFRILSPLVGYILFMRGKALYMYMMLFVMTLFIGGVYVLYRKKHYSATESIGMASLMAFSSIVYYIFYFPAYNDPTSYLLLLLCIVQYKQPITMTILITLLLFNHENNAFLFPWLYYIMNCDKNKIQTGLKVLLPFAIPLLLYAAYRIYISRHSEVEYGLAYYFNKGNISWTFNAVWKKIPFGIFEAFKLFWIFPLLAIPYFRRNKRKHELIILSLVFFGVLSQMIIAYDISRLVCLAFPIILMGAEAMRAKWGKEVFTKRLWVIIALGFLVPTYLVGALDPLYLKPFVIQWLQSF